MSVDVIGSPTVTSARRPKGAALKGGAESQNVFSRGVKQPSFGHSLFVLILVLHQLLLQETH